MKPSVSHWDGRLAILVLSAVYFGSLVYVGFVPGVYYGKCHNKRSHFKMADWILLKQAHFCKSCPDCADLSSLVARLSVDVLGFS